MTGTDVQRRGDVFSDAGALASIVAVCAARKIRLTPLRERILELMARAQRPIKPYELLAQVRRERGKAGPPTVYRTLAFLLRQGLVHKVAAHNAFVVCQHPGEAHQVPLLVCKRCGRVTELRDADTIQLLDKEARAQGFTPTSQTLEVQGVCRRCCEVPELDAVRDT